VNLLRETPGAQKARGGRLAHVVDEQEQRNLREIEAARTRDAVEPRAEVGRRILGAEEQHRTRVGPGEPADRECSAP
jgi:hypothetical protein